MKCQNSPQHLWVWYAAGGKWICPKCGKERARSAIRPFTHNPTGKLWVPMQFPKRPAK